MHYRQVSDSAAIGGVILVHAGLGALVGLASLKLGAMETRWLAYAAAGALFLSVLATVKDHERFFWSAFLLSTQVYVSIRFLYGHAGSIGLEFPLSFITAALLGTWYIFCGRSSESLPLQWGGRLTWPIALFFMMTCVSLLTTHEQFVGAAQLLRYIEYYVFYLIGLNCIASERQLERVWRLLFIVLIMQSLVCLVQFQVGLTFTLTGELHERSALGRPGGTVGASPSTLATFIIPILLVATAHLLAVTSAFRRRLMLLAVLLGATALFLTFTRGSWGGFFLGLMWLLVVGYHQGLIPLRFLLTTMIPLATLALLAPAILAILDTVRSDNSLHHAFDERLALMEMAIQVIKAHPFDGAGPGAYPVVFKQYLTPELARYWLYAVHNYYLLLAAEIGILGGVAFALMLLGGIRMSLATAKSRHPLLAPTGLGIGAGLVALSFAIFWEPWTAFTSNSLLWFLLGLVGSMERLSQNMTLGIDHGNPAS